jgi:hypothetical protein
MSTGDADTKISAGAPDLICVANVEEARKEKLTLTPG